MSSQSADTPYCGSVRYIPCCCNLRLQFSVLGGLSASDRPRAHNRPNRSTTAGRGGASVGALHILGDMHYVRVQVFLCAVQPITSTWNLPTRERFGTHKLRTFMTIALNLNLTYGIIGVLRNINLELCMRNFELSTPFWRGNCFVN